MRQQIIDKGKIIYYQIKPLLEEKYEPADFVTIEVESGEYFVGKTAIEALEKAKERFPERKFFLTQVGQLAGLMK